MKSCVYRLNCIGGCAEEAGSLDHGAGVQINGGDAAAGCNGKNLCKPQNISFSTLQKEKSFFI